MALPHTSVTPIPVSPKPAAVPSLWNIRYTEIDENFAYLDYANGQRLAIADYQKAGAISSVAGGTSDAITGSYTPGITALTNGMTLYVRAGAANATTTPTFTPNSGTIAAKQIVKGNGVAVVAGDIAGGGHWVELQYDLTLDRWVLLNPATGMATVTATNDATFADNSVKPASTSWVRGAMAAIATAAGFACSIAVNGYCKFPSWLGGWIIQWGSTAGIASGSNATVTFPIAWPTGLLQATTTFGSSANLSSNTTGAIGSITTTTMVIYNFGTNVSYSWIAVGR